MRRGVPPLPTLRSKCATMVFNAAVMSRVPQVLPVDTVSISAAENGSLRSELPAGFEKQRSAQRYRCDADTVQSGSCVRRRPGQLITRRGFLGDGSLSVSPDVRSAE